MARPPIISVMFKFYKVVAAGNQFDQNIRSVWANSKGPDGKFSESEEGEVIKELDNLICQYEELKSYIRGEL
jgi:hypothetical protein